MKNIADNAIFNGILVMTIVCEFLIPWILKHFYEGYNSKKMVMSALGSPESPVQSIYNVWLIWLGIFLSFTATVYFFETKEKSMVLAVLTLLSILIFAIGAGLLSGIFSVNESKDVVTVASKIHGASAAIGFMTLLFFPLLRGIIAFKLFDTMQGIVCVLSFVFAVVFFVMFIMGDKKEFENTIFAYEGLWERATLLCMYIPFLYKGIAALIK